MIKEAIILAGGLGTRLRTAVPDLPKCMAPILAKPFIGYLLDYLQQQGIERYIVSLGYKYQVIEQYLNTQYSHLSLQYCVEPEPLGTGGAIKLACAYAGSNTVLILNGDSFFNVDISQLYQFHQGMGGDCTLCLKPMVDFSRYGVVTLNHDGSVHSFKEKQFYPHGLINGGIYALQTTSFLQQALPDVFSFEQDYLEKQTGAGTLFGIVQDGYFIDIGVPEDFERAQTELILNL